ncbi:MAG: SDR family oxidoreductase [Chloroflexi bacterium]|nr:SDR family oxidoreductase [Chloroflexota bacterium]
MGKLDGKVAIVTGGGSGIGRSAARMLAAEGATVVVSGRTKSKLDEVVNEIKALGGQAAAKEGDIEKPAVCVELADWTLKTFGRVDILVNNAGHSSKARSIRWVGDEEWRSVFDVNVHGVYKLTQAVLPDMLKRGEGTVITVSSAAAIRPGMLGGAPYSAAKAAVHNLMRHTHAELRNKGIRATTILPAEVDTPILNRRPLVPDAKARATMMQPEDVAAAVVLCATLPPRTVVEEIVISPTFQRDTTADIAAARASGAPPGAIV